MIYNSPVYLDGYWAIRKVVLATNTMSTYIDYNKITIVNNSWLKEIWAQVLDP